MTLEPGIRGEQSVSVTAANTAKTMGSGTLDVFATPALVALAEKTCWMSVAAALDEGCGTVGTRLDVSHDAATPVGMWPHVTDCPDIPYHLLTPNHYLFDLIYNPEITEFMYRGKQQGAQIKNGLQMLYLQADYSWKLWNT